MTPKERQRIVNRLWLAVFALLALAVAVAVAAVVIVREFIAVIHS